LEIFNNFYFSILDNKINFILKEGKEEKKHKTYSFGNYNKYPQLLESSLAT